MSRINTPLPPLFLFLAHLPTPQHTHAHTLTHTRDTESPEAFLLQALPCMKDRKLSASEEHTDIN